MPMFCFTMLAPTIGRASVPIALAICGSGPEPPEILRQPCTSTLVARGLLLFPPDQSAGVFSGLHKDSTPANYLQWDGSTYFQYGTNTGDLNYVALQ